jgi:hypothetical protein
MTKYYRVKKDNFLWKEGAILTIFTASNGSKGVITKEQLNKEWAEAKMAIDHHGMLNTYGKTAIELAEINMAYHEAQERFRIIDNKVKEFVRTATKI